MEVKSLQLCFLKRNATDWNHNVQKDRASNLKLWEYYKRRVSILMKSHCTYDHTNSKLATCDTGWYASAAITNFLKESNVSAGKVCAAHKEGSTEFLRHTDSAIRVYLRILNLILIEPLLLPNSFFCSMRLALKYKRIGATATTNHNRFTVFLLLNSKHRSLQKQWIPLKRREFLLMLTLLAQLRLWLCHWIQEHQ